MLLLRFPISYLKSALDNNYSEFSKLIMKNNKSVKDEEKIDDLLAEEFFLETLLSLEMSLQYRTKYKGAKR